MKTKKLLSVFLAAIMAVSMIPTAAFAEGEETNPGAPDSVKTVAVASIGDVEYSDLRSAVAAAKDGDTVKLLCNASGSGIVIDTKNYSASGLTIDFGGNTYTVDRDPLAGSPGTESQCFQLLTGGSVTMKNGTINSTSNKVAMIIQNYCNLTLDGMNVDGTGMAIAGAYTMSNNCGNVVINNSKITAANTAGSVAFDVYGGFGNYGDVKVTVKGDSVITGKVEVAHGTSNNNHNDLMIEGGVFNGELSVTAHANSEVVVSGGIFNTALDAELIKDETTAVKDADGKYYVGGDASSRIAALKSGETVEVISVASGEVKVPEGVVVTNSTGEDLKVNGNIVKDGENYTVPAAPAPSYDWNGVLASINALGGKGSLRVDVGSEMVVPHYIWQAIYGKNITVTFVRGRDRFVINGAALGKNFDANSNHLLSEFTPTRTNPNTGVKL